MTKDKREYREFLRLLDKIENFFIHLEVEEILDHNKESDMTQDTIRIALSTVGYTPDTMTRFEQASAILDMAQELKALVDKRHAEQHFEPCIWERLYTRTWEHTMKG